MAQTPVYERVSAAVKESGFKQKAIAHRIGVSEQVFCAMLSGERKISADEFLGLCTALGKTPNDLFGFNTVSHEGAM